LIIVYGNSSIPEEEDKFLESGACTYTQVITAGKTIDVRIFVSREINNVIKCDEGY
jgi:hypothetical protein